MLVTSRSAAEYHAMFDLTPDDLAGPILDCCAGGASFAAETGGRVVAVDPAYALGPGELAVRVRTGLDEGDRMIERNADRFEWGWYGSPARRAEMRREAAELFLADLEGRPERYVAGALPDLPLASGAVDLVLCSHLLFTWADQLGEDWHRRALAELVRVARREVRIFPVVVQGTGDPVAFLDRLRAELDDVGCRSHLRDVPYRFQRGGDQMLLVECAPRPKR
ncbi:methyltransferase family protein [Pseudonocardia hierapolitana]|uniref:Methyltransferase family protein n=1 Tax=Pseudonocardia hierapolitana TaxID=1128676 RepID=A0A561T499_9PSEU|nr:methyltransferase domain-containing protein [Pseudonocardia hierapolitana]TWF81922.1 methyltransferase family protein [Pseudonocardia hierapolitana]